ncbi:MAG: hypoxanthine phosphoribosyltransferase [Clostridia bacterium]|nr:hypoxanthine phosphoribosyltransferase [Clostridia bacterium]
MVTIDKVKVLISGEELSQKVNELAERINNDFAGEKVIVIGVLKGSFMFLSDLVKKITLPAEVYFIEASSYGAGTQTTGVVKISKDVERDLTDQNVIVVEDIIDTGITMEKVMELLRARGAKAVKLCACLSKPSRRKVDINIDYLGFEVPDEFVVGYGLDVDEMYRNLPYIGVVENAD